SLTELAAAGELIVTPGLVKSIVIVRIADAVLVLPAASDAVAVMACAPSLNGALGVKLHAPPEPAVALPIELAPSRIVTAELASAVPPIVGV
ncbi:MAG: hypothetical protein Q7V62_02060, partial [Actinomycetota bacterium]|nr:hypothetical protein [Actinomycetota bacterium]